MFVILLLYRDVLYWNIQQGKKYLLRLINTSVDTTFVFSIDDHWLNVITADFVPIIPYKVDHIVIGIGRIIDLNRCREVSLIASRTEISCHRRGKALPQW